MKYHTAGASFWLCLLVGGVSLFPNNSDAFTPLPTPMTQHQQQRSSLLPSNDNVIVDKKGGRGGKMSPLFMDLTKFPRQVYTDIETPIEAMPKLSKALGGKVNLFVKRDDMLGLTGGGNKTRKLEFVMAQALAEGYDTIVTCGAVQSNHCRLTLSACNKEGLKCVLVMEERVPGSYNENASGNNYLFRLLGAEEITPVGLGEAPSKMEEKAEEYRAKGRKVLVVPGGASNEIGATGYCSCAAEIQVRFFSADVFDFWLLLF